MAPRRYSSFGPGIGVDHRMQICAGYAVAGKCVLDFDPGNFISNRGKLRQMEARRRSGEEDGMQMC